MPFEPRNHRISLEVAAAQTRRYRESAGPSATKGGAFRREAFEEILKQSGCTGIRFYYGVDDKGEPSLVLVGVGSDDNDMVNGALMDAIFPCPPFCGDGNSLNS
jgi:hypothetical protein